MGSGHAGRESISGTRAHLWFLFINCPTVCAAPSLKFSNWKDLFEYLFINIMWAPIRILEYSLHSYLVTAFIHSFIHLYRNAEPK